VLSFQFGKRPLSPIRVLGNFSISGPIRPTVGEDRGRVVMELGSSLVGLARLPCAYTSNLLHIKQQSPVKHKSPGIPTPIVNPYLALLERPIQRVRVRNNFCTMAYFNEAKQISIKINKFSKVNLIVIL